jgi:hypothetical protein
MYWGATLVDAIDADNRRSCASSFESVIEGGPAAPGKLSTPPNLTPLAALKGSVASVRIWHLAATIPNPQQCVVFQ